MDAVPTAEELEKSFNPKLEDNLSVRNFVLNDLTVRIGMVLSHVYKHHLADHWPIRIGFSGAPLDSTAGTVVDSKRGLWLCNMANCEIVCRNRDWFEGALTKSLRRGYRTIITVATTETFRVGVFKDSDEA